jgi:hypothetical protein
MRATTATARKTGNLELRGPGYFCMKAPSMRK